MRDHPIAVFDSGVGGISVLRALLRLMPEENYLYFGDSANAPYGEKSTAAVRELTLQHAKTLFARGAKALVIACNTATSAAIEELRSLYPQKIVVGIEPALKLAVARHPRGRIVVMATQTTLREQKFAALLQRCGSSCEIIKCPCPELVRFVERGELESAALDEYLRGEMQPCLPADAIVLGCTHFPFLRGAMQRIVGEKPELLDGSEGTARQTMRRLQAADLLRSGCGTVTLTNSLQAAEISALSEKLLALP
ncbi:MAG: glutamate racemase [Oscillospiraceae bacterium]|jgi:glutamate racemase|nr:glutamate racemase [Oscillospiraceae bacterium]